MPLFRLVCAGFVKKQSDFPPRSGLGDTLLPKRAGRGFQGVDNVASGCRLQPVCGWLGPEAVAANRRGRGVGRTTERRVQSVWPSVVLALGLSCGLWEMAMADTYKSSETPTYGVDRRDGAIEVRSYAPRLMAEVSVEGSRAQAVKTGFRLLAGYIFGGNAERAKLAMTTPVIQVPGPSAAMTTPVVQRAQDGVWLVQFGMPQSYTQATLPQPKDPHIRFATLSANRQAVLRFSGVAGTAELKLKEVELRSWIRGQTLVAVAGPFYYFYDAAWTLPWNRRNEVAFTLQ